MKERSTRDETGESDDESNGGLLSYGRRSVLQGAVALGAAGSIVGTAAADNQDGDGEDDEETDSEEKESQEGVPIAIQLFTLRDLPDNTLDLLRRVGGIDNNGGPGYDAVEFAGLDVPTGESSDDESDDSDDSDDESSEAGVAEQINAAYEQTGLHGAAAHVGLDSLQGDSFEDTVQTYTDIGVDTFIVPSLPDDRIDTVEGVEDLAAEMNEVAGNLEEYDARLGFHNHSEEFQDLGDGTTPLQVFDENLDDGVIFEIDVGWALTAGYDPVEVISQYSDRTELIHMKDMADGEFYEIGEGDLDLMEIAETARKEADVDYFIYEHDQPEDPAGSVGTGAGVLSFLDGRPGLECLEFEDVGAPDYEGTIEGLDDEDDGDHHHHDHHHHDHDHDEDEDD